MKQLPMAGARILHIEDELLIAMEVESICLDQGATSFTHISKLDDAERADPAVFDVAMVDLTLRGRSTVEVARKLDAAGVPLIFVSGQDRAAIADSFPAAQFIDKPFNSNGLTQAIATALQFKASRGV